MITPESKKSIGIATIVAGVVAVLPLGSALLAAGKKIDDIEDVVTEQALQRGDISAIRDRQEVIKGDIGAIRIEQATQGEKLKNIDFNLQLLIRKLDTAQ